MVSKYFITLGYTLRITEKLYREENGIKITGFGVWKSVKNIGFAVIFKKFQKISRFQKIDDTKIYLASPPKFLNEKSSDSCVSL